MRRRAILLTLFAALALGVTAQEAGNTQGTKDQKKADTSKKAEKNKDHKLSDDEAGTRSLPSRPVKKSKAEKQ